MTAQPAPHRALPGFDLLRILAAVAVIFSHSYLIAQHSEAGEPVRAVTGLTAGHYGVFVFFILSGYLISDSAARATGFWPYFDKRVRRIFPAFILCNLLLVLLVCPFYDANQPQVFLTLPGTWLHLWDVLRFQASSLMYGSVAFFPTDGADDLLPRVVNGVLWTIRQEFTCYLFVGLMLVLRVQPLVAAVVWAGISLAPTLWLGLQVNEFIRSFAFVAPGFAAGMLLFALARRHRARAWLAALSVLLLLGLALTYGHWPTTGHYLFPALAAYPLFWFGQRQWPVLGTLSRLGDPSYGMYLWGFPVQQVLNSRLGSGSSPVLLAVLALPVAVLLGYASWHLIEARALGPQRVGTGSAPR